MTWLPFDLHPEYPPEGIPREQLQRRYGEEFHDRLRGWFEREGLAYNPPAEVVPNTMNALRVTELARERSLHEPVHECRRVARLCTSSGHFFSREDVEQK